MPRKDTDLMRLVGEPRTCLARESEKEEGVFEILAPAIGLFDMPPAVGTYVKPGSFAGYLTVLRRYYHLAVPEAHQGVVTQVFVSTRKQRVEYGQPLFAVSSRAIAGVALGAEKRERGSAAASQEDVPEGMFGVRSPTDGIFYRRANPQSPAYVDEGAVVAHGAVLALVEVMKCFNPIVYAGEPEFPARGRIMRIAAEDSTEVKHGALLFVVEPA
jgi:biotin carboxyl carrier protein